jgi:hypothetical protein
MRRLWLIPLLANATWALEKESDTAFVKQYCLACHNGKAAAGGFDATKPLLATSWRKALHRVREHEMPPRNAPAPSLDAREKFSASLAASLHEAACQAPAPPAPWPLRRLNRQEYAASIRDLLNVHFNAGASLPADGAGGEGFDNAAETLFLSPIHAEKYLAAARQALQYAAGDSRSREVFLGKAKEPWTPEQVIRNFLPRAFRRPATEAEVSKYLRLLQAAQQRGEKPEPALLSALGAILVNPNFLFRLEKGDYALASRLSYFLWGSIPDEPLSKLAASGEIRKPAILSAEIQRLLNDRKATEFAERFVSQWLDTREIKMDDAELLGAIKYEPVMFFLEIFAKNLSLDNFLDSKFTFLTKYLARHYGIDPGKLREQPVYVELPPGSPRGGLLGMAAVHTVSSLPRRTSPVLRGKFVLDAILGTPPPPPPPDVPQLEENHAGAAPKTIRARLELHRANPVCASCHNRIDPIGFGLENFDRTGKWREEEDGQRIDSSGEFSDGTKFSGIHELKQALFKRRELFLQNLTAKLMGYALGRGLNPEDRCAVDAIVRKLEQNQASAQLLVREIVLSEAFQK